MSEQNHVLYIFITHTHTHTHTHIWSVKSYNVILFENLCQQSLGNVCLGLLDAGIMGKDASNIIGGNDSWILTLLIL